MFGASAFGLEYFADIGGAELRSATDYSDSRFAVAGFGWPYLGALPGTYVYIAPGAPSIGGAEGDADLYQGGALFPALEVRKKRRKREIIPVGLPQQEDLAETEEIKIETSEDGTIVIVPEPEKQTYEVKPEVGEIVVPFRTEPVAPEVPAEGEPISDPIDLDLIPTIDNRLELKLAEDNALLGIRVIRTPQSKKIDEDFAVLNNEI